MGFTLKIINCPPEAAMGYWAIAGYADGKWITFEEGAGSTEPPSNFQFSIDETWKAPYDKFEFEPHGGIIIVNAAGDKVLIGVMGLTPMYTGNAYAFDCATQKIIAAKEIPWKWIGIGSGIAAAVAGGVALAVRK